MKTIMNAALGLSLVLGSAAVSFGAQAPAATTEPTKITKHKAKKSPKKVKAMSKTSAAPASTTTAPPTK